MTFPYLHRGPEKPWELGSVTAVRCFGGKFGTHAIDRARQRGAWHKQLSETHTSSASAPSTTRRLHTHAHSAQTNTHTNTNTRTTVRTSPRRSPFRTARTILSHDGSGRKRIWGRGCEYGIAGKSSQRPVEAVRVDELHPQRLLFHALSLGSGLPQ